MKFLIIQLCANYTFIAKHAFFLFSPRFRRGAFYSRVRFPPLFTANFVFTAPYQNSWYRALNLISRIIARLVNNLQRHTRNANDNFLNGGISCLLQLVKMQLNLLFRGIRIYCLPAGSRVNSRIFFHQKRVFFFLICFLYSPRLVWRSKMWWRCRVYQLLQAVLNRKLEKFYLHSLKS